MHNIDASMRRASDIVLSGVALICLSLLLVAVAAVAVEGRPVLFDQTCVGLNIHDVLKDCA